MLGIFAKKGTAGSRFSLSSKPIPIVADAGIASALMGDGRLIPLVIIDASKRPDVADLINLHAKVPPGDAVTFWASLHGAKDKIALVFQFKRPMELEFAIEFEIAERGGVVDAAMRSRIIYLQLGKTGDRYINTPNAPRIVAEIGGEMPSDIWENLWIAELRIKFKNAGASRSDSRRMAREHIRMLRETFEDASEFVRGGLK